MKTIEQWLSEIDNVAVRTKALKNLVPSTLPFIADSQSDALLQAFAWEDTEEGFMYWNDVHHILCKDERVDCEQQKEKDAKE